MKLGYIIVLIFTSLILSSNSYAQESSKLKDYVPPPLFGDRVLPAPTGKRKLGLPTTSKEIVIKEKPRLTTPVNSPASVKPIPKAKPKKNFAKSAIKSKPSKISTTPSKGIVKGPKVMPAVKKQNVETEVLFEAKTPINKIQPEETIVKVIKREKPIGVSAEKNWVLEFTSTNITKEHEAILLEKIIPQLDFNSQSRIFIESFATMPDRAKSSLSADRRIALSRALAVRSYLTDQEIAVSRIDLRALGEKDNQGSGKTALNQVQIQILE